jgi:TfoX/Sxy family transcriptional regulator of competence genes
MASKQKTVDYILEQIEGAGEVSARKMFGEYCIYFGEKTVALVCDDELFVKQTDAGRRLLSSCVEKPPFPGAKPWFFISGELWEDGDWLTKLIKVTAAQLPEPAAKKPRTKKTLVR